MRFTSRVGAVLVFALTPGFWAAPPGAYAQDVVDSEQINSDAAEILRDLGLGEAPIPEYGIGGFPDSGHGDIPDPIPDPPMGGITEIDGQPVAFIDIFSWAGNEKVKEATWIMKIPVGLTESVKTAGSHAKQNPWWWVAGGLAAWEIADSGVSDLWDDITGNSTEKELAGADVVVVGDDVKLQDVSQSSTLSIKASSVDIDFQQADKP